MIHLVCPDLEGQKGEYPMPTKLPRLNVVMESETYKAIEKLANKEHVSLSLVARDLIREALMIYEDAYWAKEAEKRESTLFKDKTLPHRETWK